MKKNSTIFPTILTCVLQFPTIKMQLYQRRKNCLKESEKALWEEIDASFMSEESTHETEEGPAVHKHSPTFRSDCKWYMISMHKCACAISLYTAYSFDSMYNYACALSLL